MSNNLWRRRGGTTAVSLLVAASGLAFGGGCDRGIAPAQNAMTGAGNRGGASGGQEPGGTNGGGAGAVAGAAGSQGADGGADQGPAGSGGSGGSGGGDVAQEVTGGVAWEPWPAVDPAPAGTCAVTTLIGGDRSAPPKFVRNETWEYDAAMRILTRRHAASGESAEWLGYVRLDPQARREMICHAQQYFDCEDWVRDSLGNSKSYSLFGVVDGPLDVSVLDPAHPPTKAVTPDIGADSENHRLTYDADGRLSTASYVFPARGAALSFARDDRGRCSDVTWSVPTADPTVIATMHEVDHWTYDGDKLVSRVVTNLDDPTDVRGVIMYSYDADGMLASTVVDGRLDIPQDSYLPRAQRDGVTDYVVRTVKLSDGSRWVEIVDFVWTSPNASMSRDGAPTAATRYRWNFSPGCASLPLPTHTSQDCEFERPTPMMPLGWSNPLMTPVPLWTPSPLPD